MKPILALSVLWLSGCATSIESGTDRLKTNGNLAAKNLKVGTVSAEEITIDVSGPIQAIGKAIDDFLTKMGIMSAVGGVL